MKQRMKKILNWVIFYGFDDNSCLNHDTCMLKTVMMTSHMTFVPWIPLKDSNDIHPNSSNHELTPCIGFDKTDRKTIFHSVASSFSTSFAMKLLGSFIAKTVVLQYKTLWKEVKLPEVYFSNLNAREMKTDRKWWQMGHDMTWMEVDWDKMEVVLNFRIG